MISILQRLLNAPPDYIDTTCRDCGAPYRQPLGGPLECYACVVRELDLSREENESAVGDKEDAERSLASTEEDLHRTERALKDALDDIKRLEAENERLRGTLRSP